MGTGIFYRHNIMNIDSMETFANVKGGFLNNQRDVYFVREIGESADFLARVQKMDRQMGEKISVGHLKYKRIKKLQKSLCVMQICMNNGTGIKRCI